MDSSGSKSRITSYNVCYTKLLRIEEFASDYSIVLPDGWKVELAKAVKVQLQKAKAIDEAVIKKWLNLFTQFNS